MSLSGCDRPNVISDGHARRNLDGNESGSLPASLRDALRSAAFRYFSHVTGWEIQIKQEKHGARFDFSLDQLEKAMKAFHNKELAIDYRDIRRLNQIRFAHPDPFDRLLVSQAVRRPIYLATLDEHIVRAFDAEKTFSVFTDRPLDRESRSN